MKKTNWRKYISVIIVITFTIFLSKLFFQYYKGVEYEIPFQSMSDNVNFMGHILLKSSSAFLPNENIKVKIKFISYNDSLENALKNCEYFFIIFNNSFDPNEKTKKNNSYNSKYIAQRFTSFVYLQWVEPRIFEGVGNIEYLSPGNYGFTIMGYHKDIILYDRKDGIVIGSTSDLLAKRTNDLLLYISLFGLILFVYTEFIKKGDTLNDNIKIEPKLKQTNPKV